MPKCENSNTGYYKSNEPSLKELELCAHGEKPGTIMKDKDGKKWKVTLNKNKIAKWTKINGNTNQKTCIHSKTETYDGKATK
jgi:hypothetical protein